ncbi:nitroreductase family protein [Apilactobacillus sp. TMW 2.2457]|nr:nitroreductase family protein [Apilactobacillus xinyiensis]
MIVLENQVLDTLFNHRSIRNYQDKKLTNHQISQLLQAAQQASTSQFEQQFSVISVTDPAKLQVIADVTTYDLVKNAGHYFLFIADQHRNSQILKHIDPNVDTMNLHSTDKLLASIHDVDLALQSMLTAAESMGLGGVIMGSIYNDVDKIIDTFKLPELTFPVLGLALGYPDENPEIKPRITSEIIHYENEYNDQIDYNELTNYDNQVHAYYANRKHGAREESFTHHLMHDLKQSPVRKGILPALKRQGFLKF